MPCDQIITNTVDMPKMNPRLLVAGLTMLKAEHVTTSRGMTQFYVDGIRYTLRAGVLSSSDASQEQVAKMAARLKVAYSHQVVRATAAKHGWGLKSIAGTSKYMMLKR
jgi:hypothetical protein